MGNNSHPVRKIMNYKEIIEDFLKLKVNLNFAMS
jgi:hypothetical protein